MMNSYYKKHVFFCVNHRQDGRKCCHQGDASAMRDYMKKGVRELGLAGKGGIRVSAAGCLDRCQEGPCIVIYPEGIWYTYSTKEDIDEILSTHLVKGGLVKRLLIDNIPE